MKKTIAIALMIALLVALLPAAAFAASPNGQTKVYRINTKSVWVHSSASASAKRIGYLTKDTAFTVTKKSGSWYKVKTLRLGKIGWIYSGSGYVASGAYAKVNTKETGLNIRKTINGTVLGSAPKGSKVYVQYISGNWVKLTYKKLTGWSYKKYLKWLA